VLAAKNRTLQEYCSNAETWEYKDWEMHRDNIIGALGDSKKESPSIVQKKRRASLVQKSSSSSVKTFGSFFTRNPAKG
jgi:hypothetical protein